MSAVLKKLRGWIDSWALPQLCGGLPGKSIMGVHEWLAEDISLAKQRRQDLVGCKADIRKCFDSVCPRAALCVWKWLGAPTELCQLLENFYDNQQRWFAWQGCFSPHPIVSRRGLLQGCPASPALMNASWWYGFVLCKDRSLGPPFQSTWMTGLFGKEVSMASKS